MLAGEGWNVYRLLVMVRDREPERTAAPGAGGEVERARGAAALAAFRREQPFGWQEEAVQQLAAMDDRYGRAVRARDFASPTEDPAAACRLYTAEGLAQVDEVGTLERRRGRGHARAAVLAAVDTAARRGRRSRSSCSPTPPTGPSSSTRGSASARSGTSTNSSSCPSAGAADGAQADREPSPT